MFKRNGFSDGFIRTNASEPTCEFFEPNDKVFWCSGKACNESGVVETRVGTSCGDPRTASYLIKKLSDGSKIEIAGYHLRRSAKYHPYHMRTRSTMSTCSSHATPCKTYTKIPHERKRRRHASGHPTSQSDAIAKSLGNDGGLSRNASQHNRILSPPENQSYGLLSDTSAAKDVNQDCECALRRSYSGMPPLNGQVSIPFAIPDADNEEAGPLSTSPSADEGVDLSDAMFSFDDDLILSPPKSYPTATFCLGGDRIPNCSLEAADDEDTPRTPVAIATYHNSITRSSNTGANSRCHGDPTVNYFTRSQASRHSDADNKDKDFGATNWFSFSGRTDVPLELCLSNGAEKLNGTVDSLAVAGDNNNRQTDSSSLLTIVSDSCGASDEGIVDTESNSAMLLTPSSCQDNCQGFFSPDSCSGAADISEDLSEDEEREEIELEDEAEDNTTVVNSTRETHRCRQDSSLCDTEVAFVSSDDSFHEKPKSKLSDCNPFTRVQRISSRKSSQDSMTGSSVNESNATGSSGGSMSSVNSATPASNCASLDLLTSGIARMKTKVSPSNMEITVRSKESEIGDDVDASGYSLRERGHNRDRSSPLSSCSSEGETPSAKKTRLQRGSRKCNSSKQASGGYKT